VGGPHAHYHVFQPITQGTIKVFAVLNMLPSNNTYENPRREAIDQAQYFIGYSFTIACSHVNDSVTRGRKRVLSSTQGHYSYRLDVVEAMYALRAPILNMHPPLKPNDTVVKRVRITLTLTSCFIMVDTDTDTATSHEADRLRRLGWLIVVFTT
jgi:hypothetical protein